MEPLLARIVDGAGIIVLVILLIAYAFYKWPFLLVWRANESLQAKHDATHEKTLNAFVEASAANRDLADAVKALADKHAALTEAVRRKPTGEGD